jgi:hypothetical protein
MSIRSWWAKLRGREEADDTPVATTESPEQKRFSAVDIAGHGSASEAERLADPDHR